MKMVNSREIGRLPEEFRSTEHDGWSCESASGWRSRLIRGVGGVASDSVAVEGREIGSDGAVDLGVKKAAIPDTFARFVKRSLLPNCRFGAIKIELNEGKQRLKGRFTWNKVK